MYVLHLYHIIACAHCYLAIEYTVSTVDILDTLSLAVLIEPILTHAGLLLSHVIIDAGANTIEEVLTGEGAALQALRDTNTVFRT